MAEGVARTWAGCTVAGVLIRKYTFYDVNVYSTNACGVRCETYGVRCAVCDVRCLR